MLRRARLPRQRVRGPSGRVGPVDLSEAVLSALRIGRRIPSGRVVRRWRSLVEQLLPLGDLRWVLIREDHRGLEYHFDRR